MGLSIKHYNKQVNLWLGNEPKGVRSHSPMYEPRVFTLMETFLNTECIARPIDFKRAYSTDLLY